MKSDKNSPRGVSRGAKIRRYAVRLLVIYAAAAGIVLVCVGKLIPTPLAEYLAFAYSFGMGGKVALCVLMTALFCTTSALCLVAVSERFSDYVLLRILAMLLVFADAVTHAAVFLIASGYQWNYLVCVILDAALFLCLSSFGLRKRLK